MATGRRGAPVGNKNAAGNSGGARTAIAGSMLLGGPIGAGLGGMYVGATKNQRAINRHTRVSTAIGTVGGALVGTAVLPVIGTAIGAVGGGALNYTGAKVGQALGRNMKRRR